MRDENSDGEGDSASEAPSAIFSSQEAVERLSSRAEERGLSRSERKVTNRYFIKPDANVLDVGCGAGRVANTLQQEGFTVTGIDISRPLIERAQSLFSDISFLVDDITDSNLDSNTFDYAIFSNVGIDYIQPEQKRRAALKELFRVLRPSGILVFSSHNSWSVPSHMLMGNASKFLDLYFRHGNGIFDKYKTESVSFGKQRVYYSNPLRQRRELQKCGFTFLDLVGKREGVIRYLERSPHYVAKK